MSKTTHLRALAKLLTKEGDAVAKYLRFKGLSSSGNKTEKEVTVSLKHCSYCGNIFTPETCRVRIRPKLTLNRNLSKLLERHKENPEALSKYQRNLVQRYLRSKNVLIKTCLQCSKTSKFPAQTRELQTKRVQSLKPVVLKTEETESTKIEEKKLTKKQKKRLKKKQLNNRIPQDCMDYSESHTAEVSPVINNKVQSKTAVPSAQNKNSSNLNKVNPAKPGNLARKLAGKNRHQQLSKMLAQDKKDNKPASLSMFLSTL